ncbi:MAG TPA: hypothetical protein PLC61_09760 [Chitinophagales bacterium]|nr:hypothetical protein [Chitinophagales bacterium]
MPEKVDILLEFEPADRYGDKYGLFEKFKRILTPELFQDLMAYSYYGIDAEVKLIKILSE